MPLAEAAAFVAIVLVALALLLWWFVGCGRPSDAGGKGAPRAAEGLERRHCGLLYADAYLLSHARLTGA